MLTNHIRTTDGKDSALPGCRSFGTESPQLVFHVRNDIALRHPEDDFVDILLDQVLLRISSSPCPGADLS